MTDFEKQTQLSKSVNEKANLIWAIADKLERMQKKGSTGMTLLL